MTNIKLDDTWRGTNGSFLMHYNDQLRLLDSLVDSDEKLPDNTRVTFLESAVESVPDLRRVKITDNVLQAQLDSTRPISYRSYFDLLKDAAFHLDQATKRGNKIRHTNVHFSGPNQSWWYPTYHYSGWIFCPSPHQGWFGLCHLPWKTHRPGHGHIPTCLFHIS